LPFEFNGRHCNEDEIASYKKKRNTVLRNLPAGGVPGGTILTVEDFTQSLKFELLVTHKAGRYELNP
jgi:hypothetical protein